MCAIIMSHVLLPCDITLVDLIAALSTGVATMSSLAQLQVLSVGNLHTRMQG